MMTTMRRVALLALLAVASIATAQVGPVNAPAGRAVSSGLVVGTTTNDTASAGRIGEYIEANVAVGSPVSLTNITVANVTSISLTAGDWDVSGTVGYTDAGGTTSFTIIRGGISTTSATLGPVGSYYSHVYNPANLIQSIGSALYPTPTTRISVAATTTVYLIAYAAFTVSTTAAYGQIRARRVR